MADSITRKKGEMKENSALYGSRQKIRRSSRYSYLNVGEGVVDDVSREKEMRRM